MSVREKMGDMLRRWLARLEPPLKPAVRRELQLSENARERVRQLQEDFDQDLDCAAKEIRRL